MDIWGHLGQILPNAEWDAVKWILRQIGWACVLTFLVATVQKIRKVPADWLILGSLFFFSLVCFYISSGSSRFVEQSAIPSAASRAKDLELRWLTTGSFQGAEISFLGLTGWILFGVTALGFVVYLYYGGRRSRYGVIPVPQSLPSPVQVSAQDAANKEKIVVLGRVYADPAYDVALLVTQELFGGLENSGDKKSQAIALLVRQYVSRPCNSAFQDLYSAVISPGEVTAEELRQKLWDFLGAYQKLVCWTNHVSHQILISTSGGARYAVWQEHHKEFYTKLKELIALGGFFQLPENLQGQWRDLEP